MTPITKSIITRANVLDRGYVQLITWTPPNMVELVARLFMDARDPQARIEDVRALVEENDLTAVNAARASYGRESDRLDDKDRSLLKFLATAEPVPHSSPFRHAHVELEIKAPLPIARQWWRHAIGAGTTEEGTPWSELSMRYVRGRTEYHVPETWRSKPESSKQGSGPALPDVVQEDLTAAFVAGCDAAVAAYDRLLDAGVAPEQARFVLPQGVYTTWRWSPSVQALTNFLVHRLAPDAQWEIREYAKATYALTQQLFPASFAHLVPDTP